MYGLIMSVLYHVGHILSFSSIVLPTWVRNVIYITGCSPSEKLAKDNQCWREIYEINLLEKGPQIVDVCCNVRLVYSSLCTICDNAGRTEESAMLGTKVSTRRISYSWSSNMEHNGKMLSTLCRIRSDATCL